MIYVNGDSPSDESEHENNNRLTKEYGTIVGHSLVAGRCVKKNITFEVATLEGRLKFTEQLIKCLDAETYEKAMNTHNERHGLPLAENPIVWWGEKDGEFFSLDAIALDEALPKHEWTHHVLSFDDRVERKVGIYINGHRIPWWAGGRLHKFWWKLMELKDKHGPPRFVGGEDEIEFTHEPSVKWPRLPKDSDRIIGCEE